MRLLVYGCGRMGFAQAQLWHHCLGAELLAGIDCKPEAAQAFSDCFACPSYACVDAVPPELWSKLSVLLYALPDELIESAALALQAKGCLPKMALLLHFSAVLPSSILQASHGQRALAMHPLAACPPIGSAAEFCVEHYRGVAHSLEGSAEAQAQLRPFLEALGAIQLSLTAEAKPLYHAAAVMASNYPLILLEHAQRIFNAAGIEMSLARTLSRQLMAQSLSLAALGEPLSVLTGPAKRGDQSTLAKHQAALAALPESLALYRACLDALQAALQEKG